MVNKCVVGCRFNYKDLKCKEIKFVIEEQPSLILFVFYISHIEERFLKQWQKKYSDLDW